MAKALKPSLTFPMAATGLVTTRINQTRRMATSDRTATMLGSQLPRSEVATATRTTGTGGAAAPVTVSLATRGAGRTTRAIAIVENLPWACYGWFVNLQGSVCLVKCL